MSLTLLSIGFIFLATAAVAGGFPVLRRKEEPREDRAKVSRQSSSLLFPPSFEDEVQEILEIEADFF